MKKTVIIFLTFLFIYISRVNAHLPSWLTFKPITTVKEVFNKSLHSKRTSINHMYQKDISYCAAILLPGWGKMILFFFLGITVTLLF